jgi:hypothetical protein
VQQLEEAIFNVGIAYAAPSKRPKAFAAEVVPLQAIVKVAKTADNPVRCVPI